jgi:hypothetical protein
MPIQEMRLVPITHRRQAVGITPKNPLRLRAAGTAPLRKGKSARDFLTPARNARIGAIVERPWTITAVSDMPSTLSWMPHRDVQQQREKAQSALENVNTAAK